MPKKENDPIVRATIAFDSELIQIIDKILPEEQENRSSIINQILWVIFASPDLAKYIKEEKRQQPGYFVPNTARVVQNALAFYFIFARNPKIIELAQKTHRTPEQMLEYLLELGMTKYDDFQ